jgi:hypothetical protein
MTYDQWKTTDPNDRAYRDSDEDQPSELDLVYDDLAQAKLDAKCAAQDAAKRIAELAASLEEALEYFKDRYDVKDGEDGTQLPNDEMRLGTMIASRHGFHGEIQNRQRRNLGSARRNLGREAQGA